MSQEKTNKNRGKQRGAYESVRKLVAFSMLMRLLRIVIKNSMCRLIGNQLISIAYVRIRVHTLSAGYNIYRY